MAAKRAAKRKPGRPPRGDGPAEELLQVRVTGAEKRAAERIAERRGISVSALVRSWIALADAGVLR